MSELHHAASLVEPPATDVALATLRARAHALVRLFRLARALTDAGRPVDLCGLEQDVGRLCAGALDLADPQRTMLRGELAALLTEHDALASTLQKGGVAAHAG